MMKKIRIVQDTIQFNDMEFRLGEELAQKHGEIVAGTKTKAYDSSTYLGSGTISFCAIDNDDDIGFVTAGHVVDGGDKATGITNSGESFSGDVKAVRCVGNSDCAFLKLDSTGVGFASSSLRKYNFITGIKYSSSVPEGTSVKSFGQYTISTGTIIDDDATILFSDGNLMVDMVEANYKAKSGDSGATITFNETETDGGYTLLGIHTGGSSTEYYSKIDNVISTLQIKEVYTGN